jgi:hypothetical protein
MLQRSPSHAAQRQRRYRKRQAAGDVIVTRTFTRAETDKLCRRGYLGQHELEDRGAIAEAIAAVIADLVVDP